MTGISDSRAFVPVIENVVLTLFYYLAEWAFRQGISADARLQVQSWMLAPLLVLLLLEAPALQQLIGMEFRYFQRRFPDKVWPENSKSKFWIAWGISTALIRTVIRMVLIIDPAFRLLKNTFPQVPTTVWMCGYILLFLYMIWLELKLYVLLNAPELARSSPKWYWPARGLVLFMLALSMYTFTHGFGRQLRFSGQDTADWFLLLVMFGFLFLPLRMVEFRLAWVNSRQFFHRTMLIISNFLLMCKMSGLI